MIKYLRIAVAAFILAYFFHLTAAYSMGRHQVASPLPAPAASQSASPDGLVPSPAPSASPSPLPSPPTMPARLVQVANITGAQPGEIEMVHMGERLANEMLQKPCFRQWVLAAHYSETNGLTQQQILDKITSQPSAVNVEMYYEDNHVVGFEYDPFDGVVHMNRKFVNSSADAASHLLFGSMAADNLLHEDRGHSLGFHHYGRFSSSVPYGMNYAFEGCSQQQMLARGARRKFRPPGLRIEVRHRHPVRRKAKAPHAHSK